jgi:hypothetical protein
LSGEVFAFGPFQLVPVQRLLLDDGEPVPLGSRAFDILIALVRRTRGISLMQIIEELTPYLIGWRGYFGFCQTPRVLTNLEAWIRRRLRSYLWRQWGNGHNRFKELCRRGVTEFRAAWPPVRRRDFGTCLTKRWQTGVLIDWDNPMSNRDSAGLFQPGCAAGPGRPKGSRHKLGELFVAALAADFAEHGISVIEQVRVKDPVAYSKIIASLLPKEVTGENGEPFLSNIMVVYRKPGEPAPEVSPEAAAVATAAALDAATDEAEHAEAA